MALSRMPAGYEPPFGTPLYWMNEESGELRKAVYAYLDNRLHGAEVAAAQLSLLRDYLAYVLHAPCWIGGSDLEHLRRTVKFLDSAEETAAWIAEAMEIGMDPL